MNESPKFEGRRFELALATTDTYENLSNMASGFILYTSDLPEESRKTVSEWIKLDATDLEKVTADLQVMFESAEEKRGAIPDDEKTAFLKREVGNRIFQKYWQATLSARIFGELPTENEASMDQVSELRVMKAIDTLTTHLRESLVPNIYSDFTNDNDNEK